MDAARQILSSNRTLTFFLVKMVAAYAVWFVLYDLWLLPDGRIDAWLSHSVASWTGGLLGVFYETAFVDGRTVWITRESGILIENGCNGLSALSLFVGFIVAYPGTWARRALFIPLGLLALVATNVARCAILLLISHYAPSLFDSVHGFHALFVFYVVIFLLWVAWAHYGEPSKPSGTKDGGVAATQPALATA
ncbi:MAG: archaeosortase/exosortase family protein [Bacteroidota bacterium]